MLTTELINLFLVVTHILQELQNSQSLPNFNYLSMTDEIFAEKKTDFIAHLFRTTFCSSPGLYLDCEYFMCFW